MVVHRRVEFLVFVLQTPETVELVVHYLLRLAIPQKEAVAILRSERDQQPLAPAEVSVLLSEAVRAPLVAVLL
jgi:hypothetical protein